MHYFFPGIALHYNIPTYRMLGRVNRRFGHDPGLFSVSRHNTRHRHPKPRNRNYQPCRRRIFDYCCPSSRSHRHVFDEFAVWNNMKQILIIVKLAMQQFWLPIPRNLEVFRYGNMRLNSGDVNSAVMKINFHWKCFWRFWHRTQSDEF